MRLIAILDARNPRNRRSPHRLSYTIWICLGLALAAGCLVMGVVS